jgi:hypothetical protein
MSSLKKKEEREKKKEKRTGERYTSTAYPRIGIGRVKR